MILAMDLGATATGDLRRLRWGNWLTQLVVTRRCNLACGYCNEYDKTSSPVPYETLVRAIEHLRGLGTFSLDFTGGEPLLHPRLVDVLAHAKAVGIPRTRMITNGYLLTERTIGELNRVQLRSLQISVDGVHRNRATIKVLDHLRKRLELLRKHAKFEVTVSAVVGATSVEEAETVLDYARTSGFRTNVNLLHDGNGQLRLPAELLRKYRDLILATHGPRYDLEGDYRWRMVNDRDADFRCRAGARYLYVDEHQQVFYCSQTRTLGAGKSLFDYTWDDLKTAFYASKPCSARCTVGCARRVSRLDEWRPSEGRSLRWPTALAS